MKVELDLDKNELKKFLKSKYGFDVLSLEFVPEGEVSYCYIVKCKGKEKYFLKLFGSSRMAEVSKERLDFVLGLTKQLHDKFGIQNITFPIPTFEKELYTSFNGLALVVFNFIQGKTVPRKMGDKTFIKLARLLASIHKLASEVRVPKQYTEKFEIEFGEDFKNGLKALENLDDKDIYKKRLVDLVLPQKKRLNGMLNKLKKYQKLAQLAKTDFVIAHTDPIMNNLMIDNDGEIYIVDWEGVKLAPPEHDLMFSIGEKFPLFMKHYQQVCGKVKLNADIFAFYFYKRILEDLTDWIVRILYENTTDEQNEHDLQGIKRDCLNDLDYVENLVSQVKEIVRKYN